MYIVIALRELNVNNDEVIFQIICNEFIRYNEKACKYQNRKESRFNSFERT